MALSLRTSRPLVNRPVSTFQRMQDAELAWWKKYLSHPTAVPRMYALYGMRYGDFFWQEFQKPKRTLEIGSGPLPVGFITGASEFMACDTLNPEYEAAGLCHGQTARCATTKDIADEYCDTVLLLNVLDHTDDPEALCFEAYRVLKKGGQALVFVHLNQEDDKHKLVKVADVDKWLSPFHLERWVVEETQFDPLAYMAVAVK